MRPAFLVLLANLILITWSLPVMCSESGLTTIIEGKTAKAVIVVSAKASKELRKAAREFSGYLRKATGARVMVAIGKDVVTGGGVPIFLGKEFLDDKNSAIIEKLDRDGFIIDVQADKIYIAGQRDSSTAFGVYEFLERFLGIKWLIPLDIGEHIPLHNTVAIPLGLVKEEPAFFHRWISGVETKGLGGWDWLMRNKFRHRVYFHHNLCELLPVDKYGREHPEYYPLIDGKRFVPAKETNIRWQPCFSNPEVVDVIAENICTYIEAHPGTESISLGINDAKGFCECPECKSKATNDRWFIMGGKSYSNLYYDWCNKVIAKVQEKYPDMYFGCLAYDYVIEPPTNMKKLNKNLLPFMTHDRMQWVYPKTKEMGQKLTRDWAKVAPTTAWYDYIYGSPYLVPRVWFHTMGGYLKFAHENNVRAYYGEAYPNWAEGPKLYVLGRLLWNPYRNVDDILEEWYVAAVGEKAAPLLREYYEHWEIFWKERAVNYRKWSRGMGRGCQWATYTSAEYMDLVHDYDIEHSRELLEQAVKAAGTEAQKKRAQFLLDGFEYYEMSYTSYDKIRKCGAIKISSDYSAKKFIQQAIACIKTDRKRRALGNGNKHKLLYHPIKPSRIQLDLQTPASDNWGGDIIAQIKPYVKENPTFKKYILTVGKKELKYVQKYLETLLK